MVTVTLLQELLVTNIQVEREQYELWPHTLAKPYEEWLVANLSELQERSAGRYVAPWIQRALYVLGGAVPPDTT